MAGHYILKEKGNSENMISAYRKVKEYTLKTHNYWGLELVDCLVKNSKTLNNESHSDLEVLFMGVFKEAKLRKNHEFIMNLKLIWKTWTFIFENKYIKNIKPKVSSHH